MGEAGRSSRRVHIEDLRIRGQNQHIQWFTSGEEVQMTINPLELFFRDFTARRVRARGFVFRLTPRLDGSHVEDVDPALLPPIPGLANPPSPKPEEIYTRSKKSPWVIALHDIAIDDVRQIWIEQFAYEGDGTVTAVPFQDRHGSREGGRDKARGGCCGAVGEAREMIDEAWLARLTLFPTARELSRFGPLTATPGRLQGRKQAFISCT